LYTERSNLCLKQSSGLPPWSKATSKGSASFASPSEKYPPTTLYQQEVYATLRTGDDLTIAVRLDLPPREVERTVHLREDRLFEGEGMPQPTADPLPFMRAFYEPLMQRVGPGDVFTITFRVQRP
jgi:hypothetical protein